MTGFEVVAFPFATAKGVASLVLLVLTIWSGLKFFASMAVWQDKELVGLQRPRKSWTIGFTLFALALALTLWSPSLKPVVKLDTGGVGEERRVVLPPRDADHPLMVPREQQRAFDEAIRAREAELEAFQQRDGNAVAPVAPLQ